MGNRTGIFVRSIIFTLLSFLFIPSAFALTETESGTFDSISKAVTACELAESEFPSSGSWNGQEIIEAECPGNSNSCPGVLSGDQCVMSFTTEKYQQGTLVNRFIFRAYMNGCPPPETANPETGACEEGPTVCEELQDLGDSFFSNFNVHPDQSPSSFIPDVACGDQNCEVVLDSYYELSTANTYQGEFTYNGNECPADPGDGSGGEGGEGGEGGGAGGEGQEPIEPPDEQEPDTGGDGDGDGIPDGQDGDSDGDGIPNGSDPDRDGDGIPNGDDLEPDGDEDFGNASAATSCDVRPVCSNPDPAQCAILMQQWYLSCPQKSTVLSEGILEGEGALTFESSLVAFKSRLETASVISDVDSFFSIPAGGSCPTWSVDAWAFSITIDQFCSSAIPWTLIYGMIIACASFAAARIAFI